MKRKRKRGRKKKREKKTLRRTKINGKEKYQPILKIFAAMMSVTFFSAGNGDILTWGVL